MSNLRRKLSLFLLLSLVSAESAFASTIDNNKIRQYLFDNITTETHIVNKQENRNTLRSIPGAVLASPSNRGHEFSQDYQFHWVRDAAIVMSEVAYLYEHASPDEKKKLKPYLMNYINFERKAQQQISRPGEQTLGQPKYNIDGTIWEGDWARPQTDGPALRAITMIMIAKILKEEGHQVHFLDVITMDLDYVAFVWRQPTYDLWEEVNDVDHFFTKMVQRKALLDAAMFLRDEGDVSRANYYSQTAKEITESLERHWNAGRGYFSETVNQQYYKGGGLDTSILLGVLLGNINQPEDPYAVNSDRVMSTVFYLRSAFAGLYRINMTHASNPPLLGRYPSDVYDGNHFVYGNPWILTTNALAEYYYTLAKTYLRLGKITITKDNILFFQQLNPGMADREEVIFSLSNPDRFNFIVNSLVKEGDKTLEAVQQYAVCYGDNSCLHFAEQVDRSSGAQASARDLTWGYSSLLAALQARP